MSTNQGGRPPGRAHDGNDNNSQDGRKPPFSGRCRKCGQTGHRARDCPARGTLPLQPAALVQLPHRTGTGQTSQPQRPPTTTRPGTQQQHTGAQYFHASQTESVDMNTKVVMEAIDKQAKDIVCHPPVLKSASKPDSGTDGKNASGKATKTLDEKLAGSSNDSKEQTKYELSEEEINAKTLVVKQDFGLRNSFGRKGSVMEIATNYLSLNPPSHIYVYEIDMIRPPDPNASTNTVKEFRKKADRFLIMSAIVSSSSLQAAPLQRTPRTWVHDGKHIWSTKKLWDAGFGATVLTDTSLRYMDEMHVRTDVQSVKIAYIHAISLGTSPALGKLLYDRAAPTFDDSIPALLTAGLNAFLTATACEANNKTITGGNRSFQNDLGKPLGRSLLGGDAGGSKPLDYLRALHGFFLSTRLGTERLLINTNTATSPYFADLTVAELCKRAGDGRTNDQIFQILKGIRVRILYDTQENTTHSFRKIRFITDITWSGPSLVTVRPPQSQIVTNLKHFYAQNYQYRRHALHAILTAKLTSTTKRFA